MSSHPLDLLVLGSADAIAAAAAANGWTVTQAETAANAALCDAVLLSAPTRQALAELRQQPALAQAAFDSAVVVLAGEADEEIEADLLRLGVEAIVPPGDAAVVLRAIRHAVERKRLERATRTAYATDLATGLPHQAQLLEHMTQLLALREREPAPMVLIVLRVEGYAGAAARLGSEAANILRRKVAVRLRSALRASDVVAAMGPDAFGVLLGHVESPGDGERVAAKLVRSLQQPFMVAGQPCAVAAAVGLAHTPEHGKDAESLLQRASAQAGSLATLGRDGFAASTERGPSRAANDDPV
ncbi:MAG: GGDEF domain-containing protein [Betaproteobacteria bacterium]|jgi:diguanylate cyclase (GGDEF)-like protein|nr:GGDEF domain-containing protein [Betaproteobacteria bacterium]MBK8866038.1 GGDEF domain-containing protein [Betaproteobacteria bacterium]MBK9684766.1 GGDEF domain-containing protein [Betaproteobacteria bacterium]MBL0297083.1 GGDEF domain-containing protein [Betaproteobacteria bacterium]